MATSATGAASAPQNPTDRDVLVALMMLREAVLSLPQAIALNMQGGTAQPADDPAKPQGAVARSMSALTNAIKGPLLALSTYLGTTTSGFSLFSSALKVFATAVAPLVMPLFFSLAAGLTALSDTIFKKIGPVLGKFFDAVLGFLLPAVSVLVTAVERVAKVLGKIGDITGISGSGSTGVGAGVGALLGFKVAGPLGALVGGGLGVVAGAEASYKNETPSEYYKRLRGEGRSRLGATFSMFGESLKRPFMDRTDAPAPGTDPTTGRAVRDTLRELAMSIGPKGSTGTVSSIYSRAQQAAMNMSPYETRMLAMAQQVLNELAKSAGRVGAYTDSAAAGDLAALRRIMAGGA